ncbi:MAG: hypothetical protein HYS32_00930 [Candidatus Woesearchaeota archaeon]|nr:MAG: hypothetical protein HYS32_00930 [Candidatus Woesearchaeota archaeon]
MRHKYTLAVLFVVLVFFSYLASESSSVPITGAVPSDIEVREDGSFCGDSLRQIGEDCSSCPSDVQCSDLAFCDNGVCIKKQSGFNSKILFGVLIVVLFLAVSYLAYYLFKRRTAEKEEVIEGHEPLYESQVKEEREITENIHELQTYVERALALGYDKKQLKPLLEKQGWNNDDIDFVFRQVR